MSSALGVPRGRPAPRARDTVIVLATAATVLLLSAGAASLRVPGSSTSLWWPAAGVSAAAVILTSPRRRWWTVMAIVVASGLGNYLGGQHTGLSAAYGVFNGAEAAVVCWWVSRGAAGRPVLRSTRDLWRLVVGAVMGAGVLALGASTSIVVLTGGPWGASVGHLMASHVSALLLIVPLAMLGDARAPRVGLAELSVQWAVVVAVPAYVFWPRDVQGVQPLSFLPLVPLVWGALRRPPRVVGWQLLTVMVTVSGLTALGGGPFAVVGRLLDDPMLVASVLEVYIVVTSVVTLSLSLAMAENRRMLEQVSRSERMFRSGFEDALLGTVILRCGGSDPTIVEVNDAAAEALGGHPSTLVGSRWREFLPADDDSTLPTLISVCVGTQPGWRGEMRLIDRRRGRELWADVAAAGVASADASDDTLVILHLIDVTARREAEQELERLTLHDPLTGLPNRMLLADRLDHALAARQHHDGGGPALVFLDVDDFKRINDSDGHEAGDRVLVEVARRLSAAVRATDTVARLGGDEFVVLLPSVADKHLDEAVRRITDVFIEPMPLSTGLARITASAGVVSSRPDSTAASMLREADTAVHVSKEMGQGRVTLYREQHSIRASRAAHIVLEFSGAVERGELELDVQPVVDLRTLRVVAGETLVRWNHPVRGRLLPGEWLDVVERSAGYDELGQWVLEESCRLASSWSAILGASSPRVHVNVSGRQLAAADLASRVSSVIDASGLPWDRLVLELTETQFAEASSSLRADLELLRRLGIGLAVDDFGTGYSAFNRLTDFPVDMVKIDRSFVSRMFDDDRSRAIVTAVIGLGRSLGLDIVAEGVELAAQARALRDEGCTTAQGFLYSRPVAAADFLDVVRALEREHGAAAAARPEGEVVP